MTQMRSSPRVVRQSPMNLLPDTQNCGLRMRRECRERFPRLRLQKKLLASDPDMHHGTWRTCRDACRDRWPAVAGENVPGIPGACATRYFTYLARGPWGAYLYYNNTKSPNEFSCGYGSSYGAIIYFSTLCACHYITLSNVPGYLCIIVTIKWYRHLIFYHYCECQSIATD